MADQLLWRTAKGFTAFCVFQPTCGVAKTLSVSTKTEIWNSYEYQFNV